MPSTSVGRTLLGTYFLALYVSSVQWLIVLATPFYFPVNGYETDRYYYNNPSNSDALQQSSANGYYYAYPSNTITPTLTQNGNIGTFDRRVNYYGLPGYEDFRTRQDNRYIWNDPYARRQWNNYYQGYYYPSAIADSWNDRRDGSTYYTRRRQDSFQTTDTTTAATTTTLRPSIPRKKKLFVPNVWGK